MNNNIRQSLEPEYFESLYIKNPDPWRFATSEYERGKYEATLAAISGRKIRSAFEIGCSIGILTRHSPPTVSLFLQLMSHHKRWNRRE